jgi:hypothetical protein
MHAFDLRLTVYDVLGKEAAALIPPGQNRITPGSYTLTWDGSDFNSGVYFYRLIVSDYESGKILYFSTKKMILLK